MIILNPKIENLIMATKLNEDCDSLAHAIVPLCDNVEELIDAGVYASAVKFYLQIVKSIAFHFVAESHFDYFDDLYSPDYVLQGTMMKFIKSYKNGIMDAESYDMLRSGIAEVGEMEAYQDYGHPYVCSMKV